MMPRSFADVAYQVCRTFDVGDHLHQCDDLSKVTGHRSLEGEDPVAVLLEVERSGIDLVVTLDDVVSAFEITIEQHCSCSGNQLGDRRG